MPVTPEELTEMLTSGKPDKITAAQRYLQAKGLYSGALDGKPGEKTAAAVRAYHQALEQKAQQDAEMRQRELAVQAQEAQARQAEAEAQREASDPTNVATRMAVEGAPYVAGIGAGYGMSRALSGGMQKADDALGEQVSRLAKDQTLRPEVAQGQLNRLRGARRGRTAAQFMIPGALVGAGAATQQYLAPQFDDPRMQEAIKLIGTGETAAGLTVGAKQMIDTIKRPDPIDAVDEARIRSRALGPAPEPEISPKPAAPASAGPKPGTKAAMLQQAKDYGIKGRHSMNKGELAKVLAQQTKDAGSKRGALSSAIRKLPKSGVVLPLAAGSLAASMADAEAGQGATMADRGVNAAAAGGTAAGATYGLSKLAERIPQGVMPQAAPGFAPGMIDSMTDYSPEELNMGRNYLARNLPESLQVGAIGRAGEMAQVPEQGRAPWAARAQQSIGGSDFDRALAQFEAMLAEGM